MEIVINIPEEMYNDANILIVKDLPDLRKIIAEGTPLPKGHGRLIDGDKLLEDIKRKNPSWWNEQSKSKAYARLVYYWAVKEAETIIEADKEED